MKTVVLRFAAAAVLSTGLFQAIALEHAPAPRQASIVTKPGPAIPPPFCPRPHACGDPGSLR